MTIDPSRVLFLGKGVTAICYYRVLLPAMAMGADWAGVVGEPPNLSIASSRIKGETTKPDFTDYDIAVLQQPVGERWHRQIQEMQECGIKVLFEIDDYLHGIPAMNDHSSASYFTPKYLREVEQGMEVCDGTIVSTDYLRRKYSKFSQRTFVCPNGIDLARYDLELPERPDVVNVGWAGATGHLNALKPWLQQLSLVMQMRDNVNFVSIGQRFADAFADKHGADRALSVPWAAIEQYPAAMTLFDVALAPSGNTRFHRGKSDLRWVEASALGIPVIGATTAYPEIKSGETGFKASNPQQVFEYLVMLTGSPDERRRIGSQAKEYIREHRTIQKLVANWERAFVAIMES